MDTTFDVSNPFLTLGKGLLTKERVTKAKCAFLDSVAVMCIDEKNVVRDPFFAISSITELKKVLTPTPKKQQEGVSLTTQQPPGPTVQKQSPLLENITIFKQQIQKKTMVIVCTRNSNKVFVNFLSKVILPEFTLVNYKGGNAQMLPKQKIYVFVRKASTGTATVQKPAKPAVKYMDPIALVTSASSSSSSTSSSSGPPPEEKLFFKVMSIEGSILVGAVVSEREKKKGEFYLVLPVVIKNNVVTSPVSQQLTPSQGIVVDKKLTQKYGTNMKEQYGPLIMQVNAENLQFIPKSPLKQQQKTLDPVTISFENSGSKKNYMCYYYTFNSLSLSSFTQQQKQNVQQAKQKHKKTFSTDTMTKVGSAINTYLGTNVDNLVDLLYGVPQQNILTAALQIKRKKAKEPNNSNPTTTTPNPKGIFSSLFSRSPKIQVLKPQESSGSPSS